jgi:AcrR family transcriptional regulator
MGIAERREREREQVRALVLESAHEILSSEGLDALSMRAIAERIEYSPATIYLYFRDKEELVGALVVQGFERMDACVAEEIAALGAGATDALARYGAMGRAYARFALEHTAFFRVMFELPRDPRLPCPSESPAADAGRAPESGFSSVVATVAQAAAERGMEDVDAERTAVIGWGLMHGLTSLYLSGHLRGLVASNEEFLALIEEAKHMVFAGWKPGA